MYSIFLVQGQNKGSLEVLELLKKNPESKKLFQVTLIASKEEAQRHQLTGFPAIRIGNQTAYGTDALVAIKKIIAQTKETEDAPERQAQGNIDCGTANCDKDDWDIDVSKISKDNFDPSMFYIQDNAPKEKIDHLAIANQMKLAREKEKFFP